MDTLRLRIMARKSIFYGGKEDGLSVQSIINKGHQSYLAFQYYNYEKVSFLPDILKELGIINDFIIDKPGKLPELFKKWKNYTYIHWDDLKRMKHYAIRKKQKKANLNAFKFKVIISKMGHKNKQIKKPLTYTGKIVR